MSRAISHPLIRRWSVLAASCLTVLVVDVMAGSAHAASQDEQEKACRGDAIKFCSAEIPNKEKITACMKQHKSQLNPGCRAMFKPEHHSADQSG